MTEKINSDSRKTLALSISFFYKLYNRNGKDYLLPSPEELMGALNGGGYNGNSNPISKEEISDMFKGAEVLGLIKKTEGKKYKFSACKQKMDGLNSALSATMEGTRKEISKIVNDLLSYL